MHARVTTETAPVEPFTLTPALVWRKAKMSSPLSTLLDSSAVGPFRIAKYRVWHCAHHLDESTRMLLPAGTVEPAGRLAGSAPKFIVK
jgi:hypothetical protein